MGETPQPQTLSSDDNAAAIDNQEMRFVVYAWPVENGSTGNRAFAVDQAGEVFATYSHYYDRWNKPLPNAAYSYESENAQNLQGRLGDMGQDDNYWYPAY